MAFQIYPQHRWNSILFRSETVKRIESQAKSVSPLSPQLRDLRHLLGGLQLLADEIPIDQVVHEGVDVATSSILIV